MIDFSHVVNKLVSEFGDETIALEYMDTNEAGRLLNIMEDQLGVLNNSEITTHTETAEQFKKYKDEWSKLFDMIEAHFVMYHPDDDET
jgi:chromosome condensin MukBEF complex kleisin-like MukF subunit